MSRTDDLLARHLEMIQSTIARMAQASSSTKGWLLPVVTAAYGYSLAQNTPGVAWLGVAATVVFAYVDAHYLRQEQLFRRLYSAVLLEDPRVPRFCMDTSVVRSDLDAPLGRARRFREVATDWVPGRRVWLSWSIGPIYSAMLTAGVLIAAVWTC